MPQRVRCSKRMCYGFLRPISDVPMVEGDSNEKKAARTTACR